MSEMFSNKSCEEFSYVLSSKAPVPGGGGAAALCGALSAALCSMVANITSGRKKYAQYEDDIQRVIADCDVTRKKLLELVNKDAEGFEPLQKAYSIPKDNPERETVMEKASLDACVAPIEMMREIAKSIDMLEEMRIKGSVTVKSDVGCGALIARAAIESASMNIYINTKPLKCEKARMLEKEADDLLEEYIPKAEKTAKLVMEDLRK
ncbi:MAG: cyclodeaminase/cyclohydrolase family protein [Eubacterium sp.]|nr:cyclodeaminase/cyclohydrolase family protein [Eubacterium sp.]